MQIPSKIKIGAHDILIKKVGCKDIESGGEYNNYYNTIKIRVENDTPESNVSECFLHEIIECIVNKLEIKISHPDLTVLSETLFQTMRDNNLSFENDED